MTRHLHPSPRSVLATAATLGLAATVAVASGAAGGATGERSLDRPVVGSATRAPRNGRIVLQRLDPATGKIRIYTVRPNGSGLRAITLPGAGEDKDSLPDWSPDGNRITFRRFFNLGQPNERTDVFVVNRDGTGLRNVTRGICTGDCLGDEDGAWSPDGRQIAFIRGIGPLPADGPPPVVGVFVMDADGSHVRQLTQLRPGSDTEDHGPTWSPDGRRIAFMRSDKATDTSAIYTVNADGGGLRLVRRMPHEWPGAGEPDWSPDGSRLLYTTYCLFGNCGQPATGAQLFTIDPNGRRLRQLTDLPGNSYNGRWAPDGKKIVFARNRRLGPEGDVYTMNADGTGVRRVTHTPELDAHAPDWGRRRAR